MLAGTGKLFLLGLVAIGLFGCGLAGSDECGPTTCPPGPVYARFPADGCSGVPIFRPVYGQWGVCQDGDLREISEIGISDYSFETPDCDLNAVNATYSLTIIRFSACLPYSALRDSVKSLGSSRRFEYDAMGSSYIYLPNINHSYVSPQPFVYAPREEPYDGYEECYSEGNCTLANGQPAQRWQSFYSNPECGGPGTSYFNPYDKVGECLNYYNRSYEKIGCIDEHTAYFAEYVDPDCTKPSRVHLTRNVCSPYSYGTNHCKAPPTQLPDISWSTPASLASSLSIPVLLVMVAIFSMMAHI